ncbi:muscarinic acetylcholine receptor M3 [Nematostella vectensis]|uniref:muscarinic acetylcholine receptor M3 n=1 Tax=Nematostella vectensis TaxID=45351 RepID=UPI002077451B|nr:muscarinic acetylcholine receptor M3 [Nematostella vectensis]XP_032234979.2 muscarinic acetylcholine receptor M3 [Nematostella vectensis]XP_032234980.2 muscarinic acetylcholine receptor M3 [Nematostella vectensis]XP_048578962.1 muscarinic acetylcholine receptor M3 [Nematostella vectensis]
MALNITTAFPLVNLTTKPPNLVPPPDNDQASLVSACVFYTIVAFFSVFGNIMVIVAFFMNDKLRTVTNYFVVGLAAADILVGAVSIPMWMYILVNTGSRALLTVYNVFDIFAGISSILHLMAISVERYFCVGWAIKHRNTPKYVYYIGLLFVWSISALVACIRPMAPNFRQMDLSLLIFVVFFTLPLVVIILSYAAIWKIAVTRMSNNPTKRSLKREIRTAITIAFVIGFFFIAWSPFFVINLTYVFCPTCPYSMKLFMFFKFLHYSNSAVNPVVYGVRIPEFRKTFKFIFRQMCGRCISFGRH